MSKRVLLFIEGGGDTRLQQTMLRKGFASLIRRSLGELPQPQVIVCGGRSQAFRSFVIAVRNEVDALSLLLVDSEEAVAEGASPWGHVLQRKGDGWARPDGVGDDQLFFMAQAMEAWLVADAEALAKFYGKGFRAQDLPKRSNMEEVAKQDLNDALARATRETRAGRYCKSDGFALIGEIRPERVRERSPVHAVRFFDRLGGVVVGQG